MRENGVAWVFHWTSVLEHMLRVKQVRGRRGRVGVGVLNDRLHS